ncbi:MAG TPA: hypothetical protein VML75_23320 [Kofleriaceae bacterium]|nr:hypothetical protein [Kofleriaceae bacterium]
MLRRATPLQFALAGLILMAASSVALAQNNGGTFTVTYEQVADDCDGDGLALAPGVIALQGTDAKLVVKIAGVVPLQGRRAADGKFKAQAQGPGAKPDLNGKYSVSGKTTRNSIEMVFIAQFYRGKRPLCTQSWSVSGTRK